MKRTERVAVVIPNWNGGDYLKKCLDLLLDQTYKNYLPIVVDNGSVDNSLTILEQYNGRVHVIRNAQNLGFSGGVNAGIKYALLNDFQYVALLNNDAHVPNDWLAKLVGCLSSDASLGVTTSRILTADGKFIDSTGDFYTFWGLPYPRGRGEPNDERFSKPEEVFGASGGASIYRLDALRDVGLFDEDFFAYYEDVDLSFRMQLRGWKITYCPSAIVFHEIGGTSKKISGFGVYQTFKNFPHIFLKNVPRQLFWKHLGKVFVAYFGLLFSAIKKGNGIPAVSGFFRALLLTPKMLGKRFAIQRKRSVSISYIDSIVKKDPPENQTGILRIKRLLRL